MNVENGMKSYLNEKFLLISMLFLILTSCHFNNSQDFYTAAVKSVKGENYKEAYKLLTNAIDMDSTFGAAYFLRAQVLGLLHADKDSICMDLTKAIEYGYTDALETREKFCHNFSREEIKLKIEELDLRVFKTLKTNNYS